MGSYWNLYWPLALPLIMVLWPISLAITVNCLLASKSLGWKLFVSLLCIAIVELIRNCLYIFYGEGLSYLLYDLETQFVAIAITLEQVVFVFIGLIVIERIRDRQDRSLK